MDNKKEEAGHMKDYKRELINELAKVIPPHVLAPYERKLQAFTQWAGEAHYASYKNGKAAGFKAATAKRAASSKK